MEERDLQQVDGSHLTVLKNMETQLVLILHFIDDAMGSVMCE